MEPPFIASGRDAAGYFTIFVAYSGLGMDEIAVFFALVLSVTSAL
jgi:hypothetical protein